VNWFDILKEQRQVAQNVQSFKPIEVDKPFTIPEPEDSCEERFIERAKTAAMSVGFNSFNPYEVAQRYDETIQLENHKLHLNFYYVNGSSAFKNRSPTPTDAFANWGTYLDSNKDVTDELFCWMMDEYDKLGEIESVHLNRPKKGPFHTFNENYTNLHPPFLNNISQMNIFRTETNQRVVTLYVVFSFRKTNESSELTEEEINMYIKKHFPNWRGSL